MRAPAYRDPLHHHPELHSDDTASVAELLRSKDFELSLPRYRESSGCTRINAIDLSSLHLCYVSYGAERSSQRRQRATTIASNCR